jgi:hypothetical protein
MNTQQQDAEGEWNAYVSVRIPMSNQIIKKLAKDKIGITQRVNKVKATILMGGYLSNVKVLRGVEYKVEHNGIVVSMPVYSVHLSGCPCIFYLDTGNRNFIHDGHTAVCRDLVFLAVCDDEKQKNAQSFIKQSFKKSKAKPFFDA